MITVKEEMGFNEILNTAWGQAIDVLKEIQKADMEDELMIYLEDIFNEGVNRTELNDLLAYDWEWVYSQIGMPLDAWNELAEEENEGVE